MSQSLQNATGRISRNRLINPDSFIDQRNAGALVTASGYTVDRYQVFQTTAGKLSSQQNTTTSLGANQPTISSHQINVVAQYTPVSTDLMERTQAIEGIRMRDLLYGTANARTMVYTVGIYTPVAGVYSISFRNGATTRSYVTTITVVNANTLEFHSVVVPGDTGGTWVTTTSAHTYVALDLGSGSNYTTSTLNQWQAGNYVKATGSISFVSQATSSSMYVAWEQYERDMATAPELVNYEDALIQCQRYYETGNVPPLYTAPTTANYYTGIMAPFSYKVSKRATPTVTFVSTYYYNSGTPTLISTGIYVAGGNADSSSIYINGGMTNCLGFASSVWYASAEL